MKKLKQDPWGHHITWVRYDLKRILFLIGIPLLFLLVTGNQTEYFSLTVRNFGQQLVMGVILGIIALIISFLFQLIGPIIPDYEQDIKASLLFSGYIFFIGAFAEELFFRGFLQTILTQLFHSPLIAILLVTFVFAYYHKWMSSWNWFQVSLAALAGLAFAIIFYFTNSLLVVWIVHGFVDLGYINECLVGYFIFTKIRQKELT